MEKITSKNNTNIVEAAKLKLQKHRNAFGAFLIEGKKVVNMAMESGFQVISIFIEEEKAGLFSGLIKDAAKNKIKTYMISQQVAGKIASAKNPQGIYAVAKIKAYALKKAEGDLIVACENLSDPGNMGTIIRTADAVGVKSILLSKNCVDIYNEKVVRASMGSIFNVRPIVLDNFAKEVSGMKKFGYSIACGHLHGDDFFKRENHKKNILIIGNEANGISEKSEKICDSLWKLPMTGKAESLNAAVAAGIMMYDMARLKN